MIAANGNNGGMNDHAFVEDNQLARSRPDIHQANAQLALVTLEHALGAGQRLEDGVLHLDAGTVQNGNHILRDGRD